MMGGPRGQTFLIDGTRIYFTASEAIVFRLLFNARGAFVRFDDMLDELWPDADLQPDMAYNSCRTFVHRVGNKLRATLFRVAHKQHSKVSFGSAPRTGGYRLTRFDQPSP